MDRNRQHPYVYSSNPTIISAVVERYKRVTGGTNWLNEAYEVDVGDAKSGLTSDLKFLNKYVAKCKYLVPIYRSLAEALITAQIGKNADAVEIRISKVERLIGLLTKAHSLLDSVDHDWESLMDRIARYEVKLTHGLIEAVQDMPSMVRFRTLAQEVGDLEDEISKEDDKYPIDWYLEDYIGSETGIYKRIDKAYPPQVDENIMGAMNLFGLIILYTNVENMENWIKRVRDEEDIPERGNT